MHLYISLLYDTAIRCVPWARQRCSRGAVGDLTELLQRPHSVYTACLSKHRTTARSLCMPSHSVLQFTATNKDFVALLRRSRLLRVPWLFTLFKDECGLPWGLSLCVTGSFKWFLLRSSTHSQEWPKFWPPKKSTHQGMVQPNFVDTQSDNLLKTHWTYTLNM